MFHPYKFQVIVNSPTPLWTYCGRTRTVLLLTGSIRLNQMNGIDSLRQVNSDSITQASHVCMYEHAHIKDESGVISNGDLQHCGT